MIITLYLEHKGRIREKQECRLDVLEKIAAAWSRMYAGKRVIVFYTMESKMNYAETPTTSVTSDAAE